MKWDISPAQGPARWATSMHLPAFKGRRTPPLHWLAALVLAILPVLWQAGSAEAHPLGNFTINRYSRLEIAPDQVRIRYALDLAEIPTFQAMSSLDANGDGVVSDAEKDAYAAKTLAQVVRSLRLVMDGTVVPLRVASHELELMPGQAGLQTMRLSAWLDAPAAGGILTRAGLAGVRVDYHDANDPERIGWGEMLVRAADGITLQDQGGTDVPTRD
ncbi:MAG: hypothetical protein ACRDJN_04890, partial [Chloroflexota bacterium]